MNYICLYKSVSKECILISIIWNILGVLDLDLILCIEILFEMQHTNYRELKKELMSFASFSFYSLLTIAINRFSENQKCIIYWYLLSFIDMFVAKWVARHLCLMFDRSFSLRIILEGKCNLLKIWLHKNFILSAHYMHEDMW